jgi:hypothetical protein
MNQVPEDSVLRRHYEQLQRAKASPGGAQRPAAPASAGGSQPEKGFLGRLLDKLFGT